MLSEAQITTMDRLRSYVQTAIVQLPDFADGQPLIVKVKRVSMLALAKVGKIPNALLQQANDLFRGSGNTRQTEKSNPMADMYDICRIMAESCLVSPSLAEIEESGLELTDAQLVALFHFTQKGVKALEPFRQEPTNPVAGDDVESVPNATE